MSEVFVKASSQVGVPFSGAPPGFTPVLQTFVVPSDGATAFVLSVAPNDTDNFQLSLNGQLARQGTDYTVAGTSVTWLNTIRLQAAADGKPGPTDVLIAYFYA